MAIETTPRDLKGSIKRGEMWVKYFDDFASSILEYTHAIEISPKELSSFMKRGDSHRRNKEYTLAVNDYTKIISINPLYPKVYYIRGFTYNLLENNQLALNDLNREIEIDPNHVYAYWARAKLKIKMLDYNGAIIDYNILKAIDPSQKDMYYTDIADCKVLLKDFAGAIIAYTSGIESAKSYNLTSLLIGRGKAKIALNQKDGACTDFRKAFDLKSEEAGKLIKEYCF